MQASKYKEGNLKDLDHGMVVGTKYQSTTPGPLNQVQGLPNKVVNKVYFIIIVLVVCFI